MRAAPPFRAAGDHLTIDLPGATAVFTTRRGGFSTGPYESLNLGRWTGDDPAAVEHNREALETELGVSLAYGRQVHGTAVRRVTGAAKDRRVTEADGQATNATGVAPMVLAADCVPVAIAAEGAVAMVHAGWRGLAGGILAEGAAAVRELGGVPPLVAAIGPGAGRCCYEVGEEVHRVFASHGPGVRRGRNLDLKEIARRELEHAGVEEIHDSGICTICSEPGLFFSHRRDHGLTGRQAGIAWLS